MLQSQKALYGKFEKILEPQRKLQKQLDQLLAPQRLLESKIEKILEPQRRLQEQLNKAFEPYTRFQENLKKMMEPQLKFQNQIETILEPQRRLRKQLEQYVSPLKKIQEQIELTTRPFKEFQNQIDRYLSPLQKYLSSSVLDSISINEDGTVSVGGNVFDIDNIIEDYVEDWSIGESEEQDFIDTFVQWIGSVKEPIRSVLLYLCLPYLMSILANLTTPIYEEWWKGYSELEDKKFKQEIVRDANEEYISEKLVDYRFVTATALHIREKGSIDSCILDKIEKGVVVKILNETEGWFFVEYDTVIDQKKSGWASSAYLHKFKQ